MYFQAGSLFDDAAFFLQMSPGISEKWQRRVTLVHSAADISALTRIPELRMTRSKTVPTVPTLAAAVCQENSFFPRRSASTLGSGVSRRVMNAACVRDGAPRQDGGRFATSPSHRIPRTPAAHLNRYVKCARKRWLFDLG
ncbi:hypothetical protein SKAU_G00229320 [Synaphobranchus kaupii]|uniref:Uncharacterized protein n=1 Tax=Synaphobranchus kaupii TaxID=118154 RepID=A0A9Q1F5R7_SYNKA|nr:hypothetical protein SKAU_G00229320 [Synaphobranchus kaupii]